MFPIVGLIKQRLYITHGKRIHTLNEPSAYIIKDFVGGVNIPALKDLLYDIV